MRHEEALNQYFEKIWAQEGVDGFRKRIDRGDYTGDRLEVANTFLQRKTSEAFVKLQLSPEYSALRGANAAEKANALMAEANKTAQSARRIAGFAVLVSLLALAAQILDVKF